MWLTEELMKRGLGRSTALQYARTIRDVEAWCREQGTTLKAVDGATLARFVDTKPKTHATRKGLRNALKHYWAVVHRRRPPLWAIPQLPKPTYECRALDEDDADRLEQLARDHPNIWKALAVLLGLYAALRREEIASLQWSSFLDGGLVRVVGKGGKTREVDVHPVLAEHVARARAAARDPRWVFPGRFAGRSIVPSTAWSWIRELAAEAGVEVDGAVPPHRLRHTCLAEINDATGDLKVTAAVAGHAHTATTEIYTRLRVKRRRAAVFTLAYNNRPAADVGCRSAAD